MAEHTYHFVGAAGVGMSAVAQASLDVGHRVTGSDRFLDTGADVETITKLKKCGAKFFPQDGSGITANTTAVVVSTSIEAGNPDLVAAERLGVPVLHRSEMLARLVADSPSIAVTGTSGKSTVTAMLGCILEHCGMDPSVVNGAPVLNWITDSRVGNARRGRPDLWVIEADESDRSLLRYRPDWAVITNASQDHFGMDETLQLFRSFAAQVQKRCVNAVADPSILAGFAPETTIDGGRFTYGDTVFDVPVPGRHNCENALLAAKTAELVGCKLKDAADALRKFKGVHRRLERVGSVCGVTVVDDYAHNPAKIAAAWDTFAPHCRRMTAVWRPHGYAPLRNMCDPLAYMFASRAIRPHRLLVLPVYDAGGTADRSVRSEMLVERAKGLGVDARCVDPADVPRSIATSAKQGDIVLVMGARDPYLPKMARDILVALHARHGS